MTRASIASLILAGTATPAMFAAIAVVPIEPGHAAPLALQPALAAGDRLSSGDRA